MRVLLDECLPRRLASSLSVHDVQTVPQAGWAGLTNGALLARIGSAFDAFITVDKNLPAQNVTSTLAFGVVVLRSRSNRLADLTPMTADILAALSSLKPGQVAFVAAP
jgi:hypothetical protein